MRHSRREARVVRSTLAGGAIGVVMFFSVGSVVAAGSSAKRAVVRQPTYVTLVGTAVARADSFVTLRGSIGIRGSSGHVSSGHVVIESRPVGTANWTTLTRVALKSDGTFVVSAPVPGATGAQGAPIVFFRVVFAGDATHGPSSKAYTTEVLTSSTQASPAPPSTTTTTPVPATVPVSIQIHPDAFTEVQVGSWTASGATNDLGRYVRPLLGVTGPCLCTLQPESYEEDFVLTNQQGTGTLTIKALETVTPTGNVPFSQGGPVVQTGVWVIASPTGVYNGVTGSGTTLWDGGTLTLSLTGTMTKVS
jgi:hypothetical protein